MGPFWRICDWAAIGLCVVALIYVLQRAAYLSNDQLGLGSALHEYCGFTVIAYECRGLTGAAVLAGLLNLPLLVFFFGPSFLALLLMVPVSEVSGRFPNPGFATLLSAAGLWFSFGMFGLLRRAGLVIGAIRSHLLR